MGLLTSSARLGLITQGHTLKFKWSKIPKTNQISKFSGVLQNIHVKNSQKPRKFKLCLQIALYCLVINGLIHLNHTKILFEKQNQYMRDTTQRFPTLGFFSKSMLLIKLPMCE
jgi:hypothetical protein